MIYDAQRQEDEDGQDDDDFEENEDNNDDEDDEYYESLNNTNKNDYYSLDSDEIPKYILSRTSLSDYKLAELAAVKCKQEQETTPTSTLHQKLYQEFNAYLNNIFDTMATLVEHEHRLSADDKIKRQNVLTAHLIYARNFYEMRVGSPVNRTQGPTSPPPSTDNAANTAVAASQNRHHKHHQQQILMANHHPCMVALACLLDSDAVKIVESHSCAYDEYIYLFETRLKFCAWKSKLYVILKRPKHSSIKRLTFIQQLSNCHKQLQEKHS